jgi:hypothetical protein
MAALVQDCQAFGGLRFVFLSSPHGAAFIFIRFGKTAVSCFTCHVSHARIPVAQCALAWQLARGVFATQDQAPSQSLNRAGNRVDGVMNAPRIDDYWNGLHEPTHVRFLGTFQTLIAALPEV